MSLKRQHSGKAREEARAAVLLWEPVFQAEGSASQRPSGGAWRVCSKSGGLGGVAGVERARSA